MEQGEACVQTSENPFKNISADDPEVTEIESYCVNCEKNGITKLFFTKIPFFCEVIVSSFTCDHCDYQNRELQQAGRIADKGVHYTLLVQNKADLNRQVVQSEKATISIPELDFEAPPSRGALSTVEGIVSKVVEGLEQEQPLRKVDHPEVAKKIDGFIEKLKQLISLEKPFKIVIDDPSGNSFVENPYAPKKDPNTAVLHYARTAEQSRQLGIEEETQEEEAAKDESSSMKDEVLKFKTNCPNCSVFCDTNMKIVDIPHFKEVILMATNCESCGHRENEVKGGHGIEPKGTKIKLRVTDINDLNRDVLRSDTCSVSIPELDFSSDLGSSGKFTTIEGLLKDIQSVLKDTNPFVSGDASQHDTVERLSDFCEKLEEIITGNRLNFHVILNDPAGNCYLQNIYAPEEDPEVEIIKYERSHEENEILGLNDMKTENYDAQ